MKHFLLFIVAAVALSAGAQEVICHRGYWDVEGSAQNSIRSLVKADSIGAWGSEFDVWMTADGVLVVNHDESYGGVVIETAKWKDLKNMRLANGEKLPTLKEMLNCGKKLKTRLILELKPHTDKQHEAEAARRAVKMVRKLKLILLKIKMINMLKKRKTSINFFLRKNKLFEGFFYFDFMSLCFYGIFKEIL